MALPSREELALQLSVASAVEMSAPFSERIVYVDRLADTRVEIVIQQTGHDVEARANYRTFGVTPWVWRYTGLSETWPLFTIVLNRKATISIHRTQNHGGGYKSTRDMLAELASPEHESYLGTFSRFKRKPGQRPGGPVVPRFRILRPQFSFSPLGHRLDQIADLATEATLYFPRSVPSRSETIEHGAPKAIEAQAKKGRGKKKASRTVSLSPRLTRPMPSEYTITSQGQGHFIKSVAGEWLISILPKERLSNTAPAYNFEFSLKQGIGSSKFGGDRLVVEQDHLHLKVERTSNVEVTIRSKKSDHLVIHAKGEVKSVSKVGWLGTPVVFTGSEKPIGRSGGGGGLFIALLSIGLLAIPGVGWIASLALTAGELIYTYKTGKDFFGNTVSPAEFAGMGVLGLLGAVGDVAQGTRALRQGWQAIDFSDEVEIGMTSAFRQVSDEYAFAKPGSVEAIEAAGDHPLAKLIASMKPRQQAELLKMAARFRSSSQSLRAISRFLRKHMDDLVKNDTEEGRTVIISLLDELLTPDGRDFRIPFLRDEYARFKKRATKPRDPLIWLTTSEANATNDYLKKNFGVDYRQLIRQAQKISTGKTRLRVLVTKQNVAHVFAAYDEMVKAGFVPYTFLRTIWTNPKYSDVRHYFADCLNLEHAVELRFARNLTGKEKYLKDNPGKRSKWETEKEPFGEDVHGTFFAFVTPRTERHGILLAGRARRLGALQYSQFPKTTFMARAIPHGAEHLASLQEMADHTVAILLQLDFHKLAVDVNDLITKLEQNFATIAKLRTRAGRRTRAPVLMRSLKDMDPALLPGAAGRPVYRKDPVTNVWKITNKREVQKARKAREEWAEKIRKQKKAQKAAKP